MDEPICTYGGGQYGEPEPPYGECLESLDHVAVPIDAPTRVHALPYQPLVTGNDRR